MDVDQDRWTLARRLRQYDAEIRINVVRVAAIGIFYMVHLVHYLAVTNGSAPLAFLGLDAGDSLAAPMHAAVTCVVLAWVMAAVGIHQLLRAGLFPWWLMYASTVGDLFFLTSVLALSSGPTGPLLSGYFVILIMSGLRYDLRLGSRDDVRSIMGYATLLGCATLADRAFQEVSAAGGATLSRVDDGRRDHHRRRTRRPMDSPHATVG